MQENTRHKTAVIIGTLSSVPNYPKKLKVYLNNASPYWQAVYWDRGKTYRRSLKTRDKLDAYEKAKLFYEQLILAKYQHPSHLESYKVNTSFSFNSKKISKIFRLIAEEWFEQKSLTWSAKSKKEVRRQLEKNIYIYLGDIPIDKIRKNNLLELLGKIEARKAHITSRRVLNICKQIWGYALIKDECKQDITVGLIKVLKQPNSTVHQPAVEPKDIPKLMFDISSYNRNGDLITRYALKMIALTFVRKNELVLAKWNEFDFDKAIWRVPAERMKMRVEHIVPLSKQAIEILNKIKEQFPSNTYVFHKQNNTKTLFENDLINALYRLGYKNKMSVHGFRALASTVLNENGFRADVIERQLAHIEGNLIRRAYNRAQYMIERVEMMEWWGNFLEKNGLMVD